MSISLPVQDQVARKVCLSEQMLLEAIDNIRGAVMICYPMGLPEWDLVRENLESKEDLSGTSVRGITCLATRGSSCLATHSLKPLVSAVFVMLQSRSVYEVVI